MFPVNGRQFQSYNGNLLSIVKRSCHKVSFLVRKTSHTTHCRIAVQVVYIVCSLGWFSLSRKYVIIMIKSLFGVVCVLKQNCVIFLSVSVSVIRDIVTT